MVDYVIRRSDASRDKTAASPPTLLCPKVFLKSFRRSFYSSFIWEKFPSVFSESNDFRKTEDGVAGIRSPLVCFGEDWKLKILSFTAVSDIFYHISEVDFCLIESRTEKYLWNSEFWERRAAVRGFADFLRKIRKSGKITELFRRNFAVFLLTKNLRHVIILR